MTVPEIGLDDVSKRYGGERAKALAWPALERVTLHVNRGEVVVVVGPSGCGKSTLLRVVAGLEQADTGVVTIAGRSMTGIAPEDRDVAMVFQGYALYPQMTARQILEFPLRMRRVSKRERLSAVAETAALLQIERLLDRRPGEMSGGERQRVAMGRAIVRKPRVFLFDEPLSNLDASLRGDIRLEIGQLIRRLGVTALYVTHDHVEAMTLADRIAVLRQGRLLQFGTPREIYERPATSFVGEFLGSPRLNLLHGSVEGDAVVAGPFRIPLQSHLRPTTRVDVGVRPEHVRVGTDGAGGQIAAVEPLGAETHLVLRVGDLTVRAIVPGFDPRARGENTHVSFDPARVILFDAEQGGRRIQP